MIKYSLGKKVKLCKIKILRIFLLGILGIILGIATIRYAI